MTKVFSLKNFLIWWLGGLAIFATSLWLHSPLVLPEVPQGILDHQAAPDAASVDAIQSAWQSAGLWKTALIAMTSDLIFIGVYGIGCVLGGMYFRSYSAAILRAIGWIALLSGAVFLITDYVETICQIAQLYRDQGDDTLAAIASGMGPTKVTCWILSFLSIVIGLIVKFFVDRRA